MNARNERVKDSENFGARIIKIRVAVAKIWRKEFWDLFVIFGKWLWLYLELFLDFGAL
jgi:hypothetical protein